MDSDLQTEVSSLIKLESGYGSTPLREGKDTEKGGMSQHLGSIGMVGSVAIAVNSLAGPAILQLPFTYQQAGFIPTTIAIVAVGALSVFCCLHMANTVSKISPDFSQAVEFSDAFRIFWSHSAFCITQAMFYLCAVCLNIAAIIDTAEIVDSFLGHWKGSLALSPEGIIEWSHGPCTRKMVKLGECMPFGEESEWILTMGYAITAAFFLPVCLMDLKENAGWQIFGFFVLLAVSVQFCISFWMYGLEPEQVSWTGTGNSWCSMLGVILFNFSLVLAIPSWLHEKKPDVSVRKVVYGSTAISIILYIFVGALGAMAIPKVNPNVLAPMVSGAFGNSMRIGASIFAFFIIGLDIPLFCVLSRYNLTNSGLCSTKVANILVVYLPWGISWVFYSGSAVGKLLNWGGVLFTSVVAFILPLYLALRTLSIAPEKEGSIAVYGRYVKSKDNQRLALYVLLLIACVSVGSAIIGQIESERTQEQLLHSQDYLNANETIAKMEKDLNKKMKKKINKKFDQFEDLYDQRLEELEARYDELERKYEELGEHYEELEDLELQILGEQGASLETELPTSEQNDATR